MLKKILAAMAFLLSTSFAFAAVDANKATAAELDAVKGIGPAMSKRIIDERKKGDYKNWDDLIKRVTGIGEGNAAKFSAEGLRVGSAAYKPTADAKKDDKKDDKAAKKEEKKEEKAAKKEERKEMKEEKKEAKAAAKEEKKDDKMAAAKPAASAAKPAPAASAAKPAASAKK